MRMLATLAFLTTLAVTVAPVVGADDSRLVPTSIVLREQVGLVEIDAWQAMPRNAKRRAAVVERLRRLAADTSRDLLDMLATEQAAGEVGPRITSLWIVNAVATTATPEAIERLRDRDDVAAVFVDWRVAPAHPATGPPDGGIGGSNEVIDWGVELMNAPAVWKQGITGTGVLVAVIDSGLCITHPDVSNHIWTNPDEIPGNGEDDDDNGFIDDVVGWNWEDGNADVSDRDNHGTHVAGTIVGDGTLGTQTGMAPDAELMVLKISHAIQSEVWEAIQYAVDKDADVVNGSLGWFQSVAERAPWRMACENAIAAGVIMVFSAGNSATFPPDPPFEVGTPGDVPDMITVGATDDDDDIAIFSSRGPVTWEDVDPYFDWPFPPGKGKPSVSAPGLNTVSTSKFTNCTDYSLNSGTSMAAPHVAGTVALMLEANPGVDHFDVKEALMATSIDLGDPGMDNIYGAGRVDALAAVQAVLENPADLDGDGMVSVSDLILLIVAWGPCPDPPLPCPADIDGNGEVNVLDLVELIVNWG